MKYGVFCIPKPKPPVGNWLNDGDQDGDIWEGSFEEAEKEASRLRNIKEDMVFTVRLIPKR